MAPSYTILAQPASLRQNATLPHVPPVISRGSFSASWGTTPLLSLAQAVNPRQAKWLEMVLSFMRRTLHKYLTTQVSFTQATAIRPPLTGLATCQVTHLLDPSHFLLSFQALCCRATWVQLTLPLSVKMKLFYVIFLP